MVLVQFSSLPQIVTTWAINGYDGGRRRTSTLAFYGHHNQSVGRRGLAAYKWTVVNGNEDAR